MITMLYATRNLVRGHEQVDANAPIPEAWDRDDPFVAECLKYKWIVDSEEAPGPVGTVVPGEEQVVHIAGHGKRVTQGEGQAV